MTTLTDFLAAFFPDEDENIYLRAFKAKGAPDAPNNRPLVDAVTRRRLAEDAELQGQMIAANKTRGWYFVVNAGGNADAAITRFNAFFIESDSSPVGEQHRRLDAAPLQPSIRLVTRKSVHAYWLIDGSCDANGWREMQERLIAYFDGDRSNKNPSRVMRLPFLNHVHYNAQTDEYEYKRIELHTFVPEGRFTLAEMRDAFQRHASSGDSDGGNHRCGHSGQPAKKVEEVISNGYRHKTLLSLAGSMRRRGMGAEEIQAALTVTNRLRCCPPLDEVELLDLCRDVTQRYQPEDSATPGERTSGLAGGEASSGSGFRFTPLSQLLAEPEEDVAFVWEKTLPVGGFSICSAKPKVGKSTVARNLGLRVVRGEPFLGRGTVKGKVLYLCLEEKRSEVAKHFRRMNSSDDDIQVAFLTPENPFAALQIAIAEYDPVLTIIDPLSRLVRVRDFNDYGAMSRALEPFIDLARRTACHILALHHDGKGERDGGDALLGSTALFGAVDCHIQLKKRERGRTVLTTQRYGEDIPETVVELDAETGLIRAQGDLQSVMLAEKKNEILSVLCGTEELTEADLKERVGGAQGLVSKAIRSLVEELKLTRGGEGKKGNPYTYRKNPESLITLENPITPKTAASGRGGENEFSRSAYIEKPTNLETVEVGASMTDGNRLFATSPLPERSDEMAGGRSGAMTYLCWACSAVVSSEDTDCPKCGQNLNDVPF